MGQPYFTSDLHINHRSILKYTSRSSVLGFPQQGEDEEVEESVLLHRIAVHNDWVLKTINANVGPSDHLYFLGDLFFGDQWLAAYWIDQLRTKHRIFVSGNHDDKLIGFYETSGLFEAVFRHRTEVKINGHLLVLDHHPIAEWNRGHKGSLHLHGHCHGNFDYVSANLQDKKILDVGWDNSVKVLGEYRPFSLAEVEAYMKGRVNILHHNKAG
jgi:calcineurin-like phosphoesterase family protein